MENFAFIKVQRGDVMSDWGYAIETYKITAHLYEVFFQAFTWPIVVLLIIGGIRFLFGNKLLEFVAKLGKVNQIEFGNVKMIWNNSEAKEMIEEFSESIKKSNDGSKHDELSFADVVGMLCKEVDDKVIAIKELIISEQAKGNFKDFKEAKGSKEEFAKELFSPSESFYPIYLKMLEWRKIAENNQESVDEKMLKKVAVFTRALRLYLSQIEKLAYDSLLSKV